MNGLQRTLIPDGMQTSGCTLPFLRWTECEWRESRRAPTGAAESNLTGEILQTAWPNQTAFWCTSTRTCFIAPVVIALAFISFCWRPSCHDLGQLGSAPPAVRCGSQSNSTCGNMQAEMHSNLSERLLLSCRYFEETVHRSWPVSNSGGFRHGGESLRMRHAAAKGGHTRGSSTRKCNTPWYDVREKDVSKLLQI